MSNYLYYLADVYGGGTYNNGTYSQTGKTSTSTSGGTTTSTSGLANTGTAVTLIVSLAVIIVFVAIVVRFIKKPNRQSTAEKPTESNDPNDPSQK